MEMNSTQRASYINNMPFEMFKELLADEKAALVSLQKSEELMKPIMSQRPSDNRGNTTQVLNNDCLLNCVHLKLSMLTSKMVSLNVIFANKSGEPHYFEEMCEVFTKEDAKTNEKTTDYDRLAVIYNTTVDNVKSNVLFVNYKNNIKAQQNNSTLAK